MAQNPSCSRYFFHYSHMSYHDLGMSWYRVLRCGYIEPEGIAKLNRSRTPIRRKGGHLSVPDRPLVELGSRCIEHHLVRVMAVFRHIQDSGTPQACALPAATKRFRQRIRAISARRHIQRVTNSRSRIEPRTHIVITAFGSYVRSRAIMPWSPSTLSLRTRIDRVRYFLKSADHVF